MKGYNTITWPQLYSVDYDFSAIYRQIQTDTLSTTDYFLKDTLLYNLGQLCVSTEERQHKLIWETHYNKTVGHFGVAKTLVILQKYFYYPSLKSDVNNYIRSCVVCAIAKPPNR